MSFYASSSAQNTDPNVPASSLPAWPAALDQLILQQAQVQAQAQNPQMGGLRRPPSAPPANFSSDLNPYAQPLEDDRFLFDSLEGAAMPAASSAPPTVNPTNLPTPQTNEANYRKSWERPGMGINGCNVRSLPPEAFQMANDLNPDSDPADDFASKSRHARPVGVGAYVQRLMKFHAEQQRGSPTYTLENFWKPLFTTYFAPEATMHMDIKSEKTQELRSIKIPVEALPRIWKAKFDAGVIEEKLLMENPCEFLYTNGFVVVDCPKTTILTRYQQSTVITNGRMRVYFHRDKKITSWRFSPTSHQEWFLSATLGLGAPPPSAVSEFGLPRDIERLMYIAEDIGQMSSRIGAEVSRLHMASVISSQRQNQTQPQERKPSTVFAGPSKGDANGNAYRAILSQLDGVQGMPLDQALGDAPVGNVATSAADRAGRPVHGLSGTVVQGLHNSLSLDPKQGSFQGNPNVTSARDPLTSWRPESEMEMFSTLFEDPIHGSFAPQETNGGSRVGNHNQGNLNPGAPVNPNLADGNGAMTGHSVADAVAAAVSGQGGWGSGSTADPNQTGDPQVADFESSLQLFGGIQSDGAISLQTKPEVPGTHSIGQRAPPGLSMFTPRPEQTERSGRVQGGRARTAVPREGRPSSARQPSNMNAKNMGIARSFQRPGTSKSKRGNQAASPATTTRGANGANIARAAAANGNQMEGATLKATSPRSKASKDQNATGTRKGSQKNATAEGREKRQKTNQSGNQT